jgi:hypothetical protein
MPNILLNMKPLIRIVRNAEARRFNTYPRHLSRKRPERAEIGLPSKDKICTVPVKARGCCAVAAMRAELRGVRYWGQSRKSMVRYCCARTLRTSLVELNDPLPLNAQTGHQTLLAKNDRIDI